MRVTVLDLNGERSRSVGGNRKVLDDINGLARLTIKTAGSVDGESFALWSRSSCNAPRFAVNYFRLRAKGNDQRPEQRQHEQKCNAAANMENRKRSPSQSLHEIT